VWLTKLAIRQLFTAR